MTSSISEYDFTLLEDETLSSLAQSEDLKAANVLLSRYKPLVRGVASHYFGASLEIDDLIQEGMIGLLSAVYSFSPDKKAAFKTYAVVCVTNRIQSAVKANAGLKNSPLNTYIPIDDIEIVSARSPEQIVISDEEAKSLMALIDSELSYLENQVLKLYITGSDYHTIASSLGKSEKSVDNALQRIRSKIRKVLNNRCS